MGWLQSLLARNFKLFRDLMNSRAEQALLLLGRAQAERIRAMETVRSLREVEFKVYSQWGEDGIIQYLTQQIDIPNTRFVEFGVGDYRESNTRFLLVNDNWSGLIMDGSRQHMATVRRDPIWWRHDLTAVDSFITRENINSLIETHLGRGDIGLLSIDLDGNDYWVWEALDVVSPRIFVCEYNAFWGNDRAVTIPYRADFQRFAAHYCGRYFGASLPALRRLSSSKGYDFIGANSNGGNAFFVRKDLSSAFHIPAADDGFVPALYRQFRDRKGRILAVISRQEALAAMGELPLWDVLAGKEIRVDDLT